MKAVLGIGTNIGNRLENIENVYSSLSLLPNTKIIKKSSVFETEPWGYEQQDRFLNCAVLIETELSPNALLGACLGIEAALGRVRKFKNGPRIIDVDVLLLENTELSTDELTVPHKLIRQRDFVLVPLHDLAPENSIFGYDFDKEYSETDKTKLTKI
jgi:2-amino-4-hydroxy-6-hydroxymethyldihydropteridine diphosphokinase